MSYQRLLAPLVVAALVALAGFAGGAAATVPTDAQPVQQAQEAPEDAEINVSEMEVENLSTSMELSSGTIVVEQDGQTRQMDVESATVEIEEANVEVTNAHLQDGTLMIEEGTVEVTEGTVEVQTADETHTFDLSDTNESVQDETIRLEDVTQEMEMTESMQDATISEMTLEGISGTASHDLLLVNLEGTETTNDQNVSAVVENGNLDVQDATVTLQNARVEGDTLMADEVMVEVGSGTFEADRVVTLVETDLNEHTDVSRSVEDATFQQSNVEISVQDLQDLLEQMTDDESMATATLA